MRPTVFLSYARGDDEPFVRRLHEDLTQAGWEVCRRPRACKRARSAHTPRRSSDQANYSGQRHESPRQEPVESSDFA